MLSRSYTSRVARLRRAVRDSINLGGYADAACDEPHAERPALDSDTERLVRSLEGQANDAHAGQRTGSGLREDQAAAGLSVLTDGRRVSVINPPAGTGKTRVLAEVAKAWAAAGLAGGGSGGVSAQPGKELPQVAL
jgi:hypothetical protein